MKHRVSEECLTLFNANGTFRKTQKSKLLQKLALQPLDVNSNRVDMGMMWCLASPTAEERVKTDGSPYTWGGYTNKIGSVILAHHVNATTIICIMTTLSPSKMMSVSCVFRVKVPYRMYI